MQASNSSWLWRVLVCGLLLFLVVSNVRLRAQLARIEEASQQRTVARPALSRMFARRVRGAKPTGREGLPTDCDACPCPASQPCPDVPTEIIVAPDGTRLESAEEREAYVRSYLGTRIDDSLGDDELSVADRDAAIDILMRFRELLAVGGQGTEDAVLANEIANLQIDFEELTGLGVGEFLERIGEPQKARPISPEHATIPHDGEERKRFSSEIARRLGVAEPGQVERYQDGQWNGDDGARR